jgi:hypothetical protein
MVTLRPREVRPPMSQVSQRHLKTTQAELLKLKIGPKELLLENCELLVQRKELLVTNELLVDTIWDGEAERRSLSMKVIDLEVKYNNSFPSEGAARTDLAAQSLYVSNNGTC